MSEQEICLYLQKQILKQIPKASCDIQRNNDSQQYQKSEQHILKKNPASKSNLEQEVTIKSQSSISIKFDTNLNDVQQNQKEDIPQKNQKPQKQSLDIFKKKLTLIGLDEDNKQSCEKKEGNNIRQQKNDMPDLMLKSTPSPLEDNNSQLLSCQSKKKQAIIFLKDQQNQKFELQDDFLNEEVNNKFVPPKVPTGSKQGNNFNFTMPSNKKNQNDNFCMPTRVPKDTTKNTKKGFSFNQNKNLKIESEQVDKKISSEIYTEETHTPNQIKKTKLNKQVIDMEILEKDEIKMEIKKKVTGFKNKKTPVFDIPLEIDTESINKLYQYGGEKGRKIVNEEELMKEELEILKLASKCIGYMKGEIVQDIDDFYSNKMPSIHQYKLNNTTVKEIQQISPLGIQFMDNEIGMLLQQSTKFSDGAQQIIIDEAVTINLLPVYDALLDWTLQKQSRSEEQGCFVQINDNIKSINALRIIISLYPQFNYVLKKRFTNDLFILIKNPENYKILTQSNDFYFWILDSLLALQIKFFDIENKKDLNQFDLLLNFHSKLMKSAICSNAEGHKKLQNIFIWIEKIDNSTTVNQQVTQNAVKFLLRSIWVNLLQNLKEISLVTRPSIQDNFWINCIYVLASTQEIILSFYSIGTDAGVGRTKQIEIYLTMKNYQQFLKEDEIIPINWQQTQENKWIDKLTVESIIDIFEVICPEILFQVSENTPQKIEELITNMLDFSNSEEFLKYFEIFIYEPYPERGSVIKIINLLVTLNIDDLIKNNQEVQLEIWLEKIIRICKFFLIVSENVRDKNVVQFKNIIHSNILFVMNFLYIKYESLQNNLNLQNYVKEAILDLQLFLLIMVDVINKKYEIFDNFSTIGRNNSTTFTHSRMISNLNLIIYELFQKNILSDSNETIVDIQTIKLLRSQNFENLPDLIFSANWIYAFTDNNHLLSVISSHYDDNFKAIIQNTKSKNKEIAGKIIIPFKITEKNKENIIDKFQQEIQEYSAKVKVQDEYLNKKEMLYLDENIRTARSGWKTIWKKLRIFNGPYRHPQFCAQNNSLWDPNQKFQGKNEQNLIYSLKINKQEIKNRAKMFLKLKLIEPSITQDQTKELDDRFDQIQSYNSSGNSSKERIDIASEGGNISKSNQMKKNNSQIDSILQSENSFQKNQNPNINLIKEIVYITKTCQWIKPLQIENGNLSITSDKLVFQYDACDQITKRYIKEWNLDHIREIQIRRHILRKTALEIMFLEGQSILLNFPQKGGHEEVSKQLIKLRKSKCVNLNYNKTFDPKKLIEKTGITQKWQNQEISNFEYLMQLNSLAGRSYKDGTQYPVFPWIISDYEGEILDLFSSRNMRDLTKPMGALGSQERIKAYIERFQNKDELHEKTPQFHYSTHYSSPTAILQLLVRISPFTEVNLKINNNKFDSPDKIFNSIEETYKSTVTNQTDVRELTPEFFCFPEIFLNLNNHNFGSTQDGRTIHNVSIPKWADKDPYKFIVQMRTALESENTSKYINDWIDLIFGYKQRGKEAEKALNVFYYMTYEDKIDLENIKDQQLRLQTENQIINFGQTPSQLFTVPHPNKLPKDQLIQFKLITDPEGEMKVYRPSKKLKKKEDTVDLSQLNIFNLPQNSIIKMRWISDSRFICLQRNGQIMHYRWWNTPTTTNSQQVIPFQCGVDKEIQVSLMKQKNEIFNQFDESIIAEEYPIQFLNLGKILAVGGFWDGNLKLILKDTDQVLDTYQIHSETITSITSDQKENFLITGSKIGDVIVWKIAQEYKLYVKYHFFDHENQVTQIKISNDMKIVATASLDHSINLYNIISGVHLRTLVHPFNYPIQNLILSSSPLPCVVFFSKEDQTFYSYSINGQILQKLKDTNCKYVPSSIIVKNFNFMEILIYANHKGDIFLRDLPFLNLIRSLSVSPETPVLQFMISKDRKFLLSACADGEISVITDPHLKQSNTQ